MEHEEWMGKKTESLMSIVARDSPREINMDTKNDGLEKKFGTPGFLGLEGIDRKLEDVACRSGFS